MEHIKVLSVIGSTNQSSPTGLTVLQPTGEPFLYQLPNISVTSTHPPQATIPIIYPNLPPNNSFSTEIKTVTNGPIVESIFSLRGCNSAFNSDTYAEYKDVNEPTNDFKIESVKLDIGESEFIPSKPIDSIKRGCNCMPVVSEFLFPSVHEGSIKLKTSGGEMSWLSDPYAPSKNKRMSLEEINSKSAILSIDVLLTRNSINVKFLSRALNDIINTGVFTDWLLLKCEATELQFRNLDKEVAIHSTSSLSGLKSAVYHNSCLPLPFVSKMRNEMYQYFYLVFNYGGNPKISKLNTCLFREKEFAQRSPSINTLDKHGIQLKNSYVHNISRYTFYAEQGFEFFFAENEPSIRRLIFRHIIWGYLQGWVRKIAKLYKFILSVEEVAEQLSICHVASEDVQELKFAAAKTQTLYLIGFCENYFLYLKFFTLKSKRSEYSLSITNVETNFVSEVPIVQYLRQYFYINKLHNKSVEAADESACENLTISSDLFYSTPVSKSRDNLHFASSNLPNNNNNNVITSSNSSFNNTSTNFTSTENRIKTVEHCRGNRTARNPVFASEKPKQGRVSRPLIKARTVEEINSSVEIGRNTEIATPNSENLQLRQLNRLLKAIEKGEITKAEIKDELLPYVRSSLDCCYAEHRKEISGTDETTDERLIRNYFSEAVTSADKTKSYKFFLQQVYQSLQLHFTNQTCQWIMDRMIYGELQKKYKCNLNVEDYPTRNSKYRDVAVSCEEMPPMMAGFSTLSNCRECFEVKNSNSIQLVGNIKSRNKAKPAKMKKKVSANAFKEHRNYEEKHEKSIQVTSNANCCQIKPCYVSLSRGEVDNYFKFNIVSKRKNSCNYSEQDGDFSIEIIPSNKSKKLKLIEENEEVSLSNTKTNAQILDFPATNALASPTKDTPTKSLLLSYILFQQCNSNKVSVALTRVEDLIQFKQIRKKNKSFEVQLKNEILKRNNGDISENFTVDYKTVALLCYWKNKRKLKSGEHSNQ